MSRFSHLDHPLKLIENLETVVGVDDDGKQGVIRCDRCQETTSGGPGYGCIPCHFYLHKTCAPVELPYHQYLHPRHPLILFHFGRNTPFWICDVCTVKQKARFSYYCSPCDFNVCINCAVADAAHNAATVRLKEEASNKLKHDGHPQHTLTLQLRSASFHCDACRATKKDFFYQCDDCDFWIHKTCATLTPTVDLPYQHKHPLFLIHLLPEHFDRFVYYCESCYKRIMQCDWIYHCANCRYFSHIKCVENMKQLASIPSYWRVKDKQTNNHHIMHFPMSKAFTDPLKLLHCEKISLDANDAEQINHWSHDHPLILTLKPQGNNMSDILRNDPIEVCYGCVRPLSLPYYTCKDGCQFTLHKYCAELPHTLKHQLHPHHDSLDLVNIKYSKSEVCNGCYGYCNTFAYKCQTCKFYLDVNCAFLPGTIKHESHRHHLVQVIGQKLYCTACGKWFENMGYACNTCNFCLDMGCAVNSPQSLTHRYCKGHQIPLTYPPIEDHPEDFYCDICEIEMHPKLRLYYCHKCKNSFHPNCLSRMDSFANFWWKETITVPYHKHPVRYIRRKKNPKYVCFGCNQDINGHLILECQTGTCPFKICNPCHLNKIK